MTRRCLALAAALTLAGFATAWAQQPTAVTAAGITPRSVTAELPTSDRTFPGGSAADVVSANCTICHSPGMILNQPALPAATWQEEVNKMRNFYKAPVAAEDVPAIVAYLANLKPGR